MRTVSGDTLQYTYDGLQRLTDKYTTGKVWERYAYSGTQVTAKTNWIGSTQTHAFTYTYDAAGNIVSEKLNGQTNKTYTYDSLNQLTGVTHADGTVETYTYDNAGNILTFHNGSSSHTFGYPDTYNGAAGWKDLLRVVDGHSLTHDDMGNPLSYYNGFSYNFQWTEGRRLEGVTYVPQNGSAQRTTGYLYDHNGLRVKKVNHDGSYILYHVADGRYTGETRYNADGTADLYIRYTYDENDSVCEISTWYENSSTAWANYYFVKNLQGDVLQVYRGSDNALVASYTYDAWGNILSSSGILAELNPFRYRGYYYDAETWFYYLQSRYYDPTIGRFINADAFTSTGQGLLGNNMFVYCGNNPTNYVDPTGTMHVCRNDSLAVCVGGGSYTLGSILVPFAFPLALIDALFCPTYSAPAAINSRIQEEEKSQVLAEAEVQRGKQPSVFYGVDLYGGKMNYITGPMSEEAAILWAYTTAVKNKYTERAGWGLYTEKREDAISMAITLSPIGPIVAHAAKATHLSHFHTVQRKILGIDAPSFHIWYGGL